jgi:hypothetical protein
MPADGDVPVPAHPRLQALDIGLRRPRREAYARVVSRAFRWTRWATWSAIMEQPTQPLSGQPCRPGSKQRRRPSDRSSSCWRGPSHGWRHDRGCVHGGLVVDGPLDGWHADLPSWTEAGSGLWCHVDTAESRLSCGDATSAVSHNFAVRFAPPWGAHCTSQRTRVHAPTLAPPGQERERPSAHRGHAGAALTQVSCGAP